MVACQPSVAQTGTRGDIASVAYAKLNEALMRYQQIERAGGWPFVTPGPLMEIGERDARVPVLRQRLASTGDISLNVVGADSLFDEHLENAVRVFQERHGLDVDGIVGPHTIGALNVSAEERIQQMKLNLERIAPAFKDLGDRYALVNVPAYQLWLVDGGDLVLEMKTILGTRGHKTPLFTTSIDAVVLAPYWYVPQSIARNEILPKLQRDSTYLARNHIRLLPNGMLRQDPGPGNPLGKVKFIIPNAFSVRMHDTSEPWLFGRPERAFSHGCIRLEKPLDLAEYLLWGTDWTRERMEETIADWEETSIDVPDPLLVRIVYLTAWAEADGTVHFRRDVYGYDHARAPQVAP